MTEAVAPVAAPPVAEPIAAMPAAPPAGEGGAPEAGNGPEPLPPQMDDPGAVDIESLVKGNPVAPPPAETPESGTTTPDQGVTASEGDEQPSGDSKQQEPSTLGQFAQFKMPDGYRMLEGAEGSHFIKHAAEHGLTQEQAQAQIDFDAQRSQRLRERFESQRKVQAQALRQQRMERMRTDADIGGTATNLKESIGNFNAAVHNLGGDELRDFMTKTGLVYEPVMIKAFARAYKGLGEAQESLEGAKPAVRERTRAERLLGVGVER